ncbi:MAG: hypothetical protein HY271_01465 [Deltaproteobacteria bacterium]|nr:hypothetical protein [Deltaproteobacteria bacterium]
MKRDAPAKLALLLISSALYVLVFEGVVRVFIKPSPLSYGTLLGRELPPVRVIPAPASPESAKPVGDGDPEAIGPADLQGVFREDPLLGYAPLERATSPHGWWIANNIGARSATDTSPQTAQGRRRILVFGESFASGSRVHQEDAWPAVLAARNADLEVVNLAVDGYGMGQSLLRFRETTRSIDYDVAMLVFVPTVDLWRDINTIRSLARSSWNSYTVMPRFVVEEGRLTLVKSPYEIGSEVYGDNALGLGETLRRHLRAYDRFYCRTRHESVPLIGNLVLWKVVATVYFTHERAELLRSMSAGRVDLDSEAMQVSRKIFQAMQGEVHATGKRFVLVILPEHHGLRKIQGSARSAQNWQRLVATVCEGDRQCIDVTPALLRVPPEALDRGYDKTHYCPVPEIR